MSDALVLVLVVAGSYLAARVAFDWLARRFIVVSGAEYLLLGILLGPQVSSLLSPSALESFTPITSLALGWMGALLGTQMVTVKLVRVPSLLYRVALAESLITFTVVTGIMTAALHWQLGISVPAALVPAVTLGAIGTASAQAGVAVISRRRGTRELVVRQLEVASGMDALVAVGVFGLLLAIIHPTPDSVVRPLTPTEWTVISIGIGVVGGTLFHLFLGDEQKVDRMFISLAGAVFLVSGAATYLRLSPLLSAMCFGIVLVNTTRARREVVAALERVERPLYFALLIFGGAAWQPSGRAWVLPVLLFLAVRTAAKLGSARLAARSNHVLGDLGPHWGRGLLGQGGLAIAIALNYVYQEAPLVPNLVFTAAVASVLLTDLLSARFVRSLLPVDPLHPAPSSGVAPTRPEQPGRPPISAAPERG